MPHGLFVAVGALLDAADRPRGAPSCLPDGRGSVFDDKKTFRRDPSIADKSAAWEVVCSQSCSMRSSAVGILITVFPSPLVTAPAAAVRRASPAPMLFAWSAAKNCLTIGTR